MTSFLRERWDMKVGDVFIAGNKVKTWDEGADTLIYLSLLPANCDGPKGEFVAERTGRPLVIKTEGEINKK